MVCPPNYPIGHINTCWLSLSKKSPNYKNKIVPIISIISLNQVIYCYYALYIYIYKWRKGRHIDNLSQHMFFFMMLMLRKRISHCLEVVYYCYYCPININRTSQHIIKYTMNNKRFSPLGFILWTYAHIAEPHEILAFIPLSLSILSPLIFLFRLF